MKAIGNTEREQDGPNDDHRHRHLIVCRSDETQGPEHSTQCRKTCNHHHLEPLKRAHTGDTGLEKIGVEDEQTNGNQHHSIRENVPKQFEGKFGDGVGDGDRAGQHHGEAQVIPRAHAFRLIWLAIVLKFTRSLKF